MKKIQRIALVITILFCIDYSITQLLGFELLYARIHDLQIIGKLYAFLLGVCGFIDILGCKDDTD